MKLKLNPVFLFLFVCSSLFFSHDASAQKGAEKKTGADSVTFNFKPGPQFWKVPEGVTAVHVNIYGAQGGGPNGGKGGCVQSDLNAAVGTKLVIYVGSQPTGINGGENGGGQGCGKGTGGGGASDIRIGGTSLKSRTLVAGGGGGFGYGPSSGLGGGLTGGEGTYNNSPAHVAGGGTQEAPGAGARAYFGKPGVGPVGGDAGNSNGKCTNGAMAGGGGGYYGGGAGGGGGGGGGSSYADAKICTNVVHQQGVNEGNGKVVISWVK
ncbi:MAG: C-terminal target protein [Bacteroidetes bacterium]|nr:C-terminal target protein [Bacteroidota bacterium]